tara:strand:- start:1683 stop:2222 length:540 start_codon:yes stop_codon:yes gene_type:complete
MFTRMDEGTVEDWTHIAEKHQPHIEAMPGRILDMLKDLQNITGGFEVHQLEHCLQTATRARRANEHDEMVLLCLVHDIGKVISVIGHAEIAAEIVKPYVSEDVYYALKYHQDFQGKYYYHFMGKDNNLRDKYKYDEWYDLCRRFVDDYDMPAFDPTYDTDSLESFLPLIQKTFKAPRVT